MICSVAFCLLASGVWLNVRKARIELASPIPKTGMLTTILFPVRKTTINIIYPKNKTLEITWCDPVIKVAYLQTNYGSRKLEAKPSLSGSYGRNKISHRARLFSACLLF